LGVLAAAHGGAAKALARHGPETAPVKKALTDQGLADFKLY
jgi:hypothetical protein